MLFSDAGSLCHKTGSQSAGGIISPWPPILIYKHGGSELCFKAAPGSKPGACVVQMDWRPATWICQTYNVEHENDVSYSASFTAGGGQIAAVEDEGSVVYTLSNIAGPAVFTITFSNESDCVTSEDPGVKINVVAVQAGANPQIKRDVRCPSDSEAVGSVAVSFDADGRLTGVQ